MKKSPKEKLIEKYGEAGYRELREFVGSRMGAMSAEKIYKAAVTEGYKGFTHWHCRWVGADLNISFKLIGKKLSLVDENEAVAIREARLITKIFADKRV